MTNNILKTDQIIIGIVFLSCDLGIFVAMSIKFNMVRCRIMNNCKTGNLLAAGPGG